MIEVCHRDSVSGLPLFLTRHTVQDRASHRQPEDPIEVDGSYPLLGDHSQSGIQTVDARFVGTHARLALSIQFVEIAKLFAERSPPPATKASKAPHTQHPRASRQECFCLTNVVTGVLLGIWLLSPANSDSPFTTSSQLWGLSSTANQITTPSSASHSAST
jgi:hypothetical protein